MNATEIGYALYTWIRTIQCIRYFIIGFSSSLLVTFLTGPHGLLPGATECYTVIERFMRAGMVRDVDAARGLCVAEMTRDHLENMIAANHQLFTGYQGISTRSIGVRHRGRRGFGNYCGEARYPGGRVVCVRACLVNRGDGWKLSSITISPL